MAFSATLSNFRVPKFILRTCFLLNTLQKVIFLLFRFLGFKEFPGLEDVDPLPYSPIQLPKYHILSALLIRKLLPVVKFEEYYLVSNNSQDSCALCLSEFKGQDEIRPLMGCSHIFHKSCLDRWIDHDQMTCPLCRTPFVPMELEKSFKGSSQFSDSDQNHN